MFQQLQMRKTCSIAIAIRPISSTTEIAAKAHQRANCILRTIVSKDINLLMRAFIVYVRPIIEIEPCRRSRPVAALVSSCFYKRDYAKRLK